MRERERAPESTRLATLLDVDDAYIEFLAKRANRAEDEHEATIIQLHERARAQGDPLCTPVVVYLAPRAGRDCWQCAHAVGNGDETTMVCSLHDVVLSGSCGCPDFEADGGEP